MKQILQMTFIVKVKIYQSAEFIVKEAADQQYASSRFPSN